MNSPAAAAKQRVRLPRDIDVRVATERLAGVDEHIEETRRKRLLRGREGARASAEALRAELGKEFDAAQASGVAEGGDVRAGGPAVEGAVDDGASEEAAGAAGEGRGRQADERRRTRGVINDTCRRETADRESGGAEACLG